MKRKRPWHHYLRGIVRDVWNHPANASHRARAVARAVRWQVRKRTSAAPVDVPFAGLTLRCYPDSDSASNVFYFTERYDWHEMGFLGRYLRPGDGFIDVGANIGTYTLLAASIVGPDGEVVAIEPLPTAAQRLRENVERNHLPNVTVHQAAADDTAGDVGFLDFGVASAVLHDADRRGRVPFEVRADRLEDLVAIDGIGAAKLDVEGLELRALRGAGRLVARHDPPVWLVEVMAWQLAKHGGTVEELIGWMAEQGFTAYRYDADENTLDAERSAWEPHHNAVFIADDHLDEVRARLDAGAQTARGVSRQR